MGKHFKGDDPLDEVDIRDVPGLVYRTELTQFNDWDTRTMPDALQRVSDMDKVSLAYMEEATQMTKFVVGASEAIEVELPGSLWAKVEEHLRRMKALRARMRTALKHIEKSPNPLEAYDTTEFLTIGRYFAEVYEITFTQKVLHGKLTQLCAQIVAVLPSDEDDYELTDELDEFRKREYMEVSRKMKKVRTEARYKSEGMVEDV